ncbi:hypothetical protein DSC45_12475 [Streptomyces sp. YIM 130001]|uniref:DUF692 domain-containing protein n=1 Tax=Streptomyces sp. YIM 130001 TaxID=2259644 RepID=UPI000E64C877|nr:DUF692 domain-containing protein [Streptomyces sp. YIM 130001]RII17709.1 hypothetical protein DSC45_12475 [Streptomyces sp. YIM 130001]
MRSRVDTGSPARLGTGIGWRPEIAEAVERMPGIDWVEAVAENVCPGHLPPSLTRLRERGVTVVPHGVALGLGGAERPDPARLAGLAERAEALGSPLVTEHIAFVRAGGALTASQRLEAGHLLPVPRTRDALDVLCENVRIAQDALPVPLAVENIAALISWPGEEMTEGQFLYDLVDRTGVRLLIDVANLHTNHVNRGEDPCRALDELPVEAIAYVHVAGGFERDGVWHDSHAHPVTQPVLDVLAELASRVRPPGVLLERDENFPEPAELEGELEAIRTTLEAGAARETADVGATAGTTHADAPATEVARQRVALAQAALLSSLVAGTPAPEGFDHRRLAVQSRALTGKRADVVAKVAPELPQILGDGYRPAFFSYAAGRPMTDGYRYDALDFAAHLLDAGLPHDAEARRALDAWWRERAGRPFLSWPPVVRIARRMRKVLTPRAGHRADGSAGGVHGAGRHGPPSPVDAGAQHRS